MRDKILFITLLYSVIFKEYIYKKKTHLQNIFY